jgi:predicted nucleotidyltransferase component of viral defense system
MSNDIVNNLRALAHILDGLNNKVKLNFESGYIFTEAANEIEKLRLEIAHMNTQEFYNRNYLESLEKDSIKFKTALESAYRLVSGQGYNFDDSFSS